MTTTTEATEIDTQHDWPTGLARSLAVAILWTALVFFVGCAAGVIAITGDVSAGVGIGGMAALWGGPGFGMMVGAAVHSHGREEM